MVAVATTGARRHGNGPTYHITAGNVGSVFTIEPHTGTQIFLLFFYFFYFIIIIFIIIVVFVSIPALSTILFVDLFLLLLVKLRIGIMTQ